MARRKKSNSSAPLTRKDKIICTILLVLFIPLSVLFYIYYNSSLLQTILLAKGLIKTEKNLGLPTNPDKAPYAKANPSKVDDNKGSPSFFDIMDKQDKKVAGVQPPKKQLGGRKVQKGGNFNSAFNDGKKFLDTTKFGFPYSWYDNDNFVLQGISNYFITFWTFMRGGLVKLLDITKETFYKEERPEGGPKDLGGQIFDFAKFTIVLPIVFMALYVGNVALGTGGLIWSSINNQSWLIVPLLVLGIFLIQSGTIGLIASGVITYFLSNIFVAIACVLLLLLIPLFYFFPYGYFWIYLQTMILTPTSDKKKLFREYLGNYELIWILACIISLGVSISFVWDWHIIPLVAFGGVGGGFILLRAMGLI